MVRHEQKCHLILSILFQPFQLIMKQFLSIIVLMAFGTFVFTSCVRKDHDTPPDQSQYDPGLTVTHTIAELLAMNPEYNPSSKDDTMLITQDWVISGIVTANDESGNFYKRIVIQDSTAGLQVLIDAYSLYTQFPVGRKVYVSLITKSFSNGET